MSESELKKLFSSHGIVVSAVHIISDHYIRKFKCFGLVDRKFSPLLKN
ncbi:MAG: hypothetical protein GQ541_05970 [Desulfovibrionaceae bacterium]|nr:hypothetical protein [Desulfovibrionaceae bacterium]